MQASRSIRLILVAGLLAGVLDILFAIALVLARGRSPMGMLQAIASGVAGKGAFDGGALSAVLGLALHLAIAIGMAAVFFLAARRSRYVLAHLDQSVVAFGVLSWAAMQFIVVPLSAAPFTLPLTSVGVGTSLFSHILLVGLPIGLLAQRAFADESRAA